ncbi:hypothetical protein AVEN_136804-1 [Araneus ventricosus]|uniref:Uncharacterized protein n=1 Tax=Araneus ventricosus TaxID=182803 RepID=A0A4Y2WLI2_ARAVE|nr:hypothetical protein AVEN_136804-1 [Araneus ventricosus]
MTPDASIKEDLSKYFLFHDQNGLPFTFLKPDLIISRQDLLCFVETPYMGFGAAIQLNWEIVIHARMATLRRKVYPQKNVVIPNFYSSIFMLLLILSLKLSSFKYF